MSGYTKLFGRILDSTIWREDDKTRILWITMLAMADKDGVVQATIPGLADRARISLEQCEHSLERFQQPDKYSWSKEEEGRRVKVVEGGWFLINHAKYRALMSAEEQRENTRLRVQRFREKNKALQSVTNVTGNESNDIAEADTEADTKARVKSVVHFVHPSIEEVTQYCKERQNQIDPDQFMDHYTANGWKVGGRSAMKDWKAAVRKWERNDYGGKVDGKQSRLERSLAGIEALKLTGYDEEDSNASESDTSAFPWNGPKTGKL